MLEEILRYVNNRFELSYLDGAFSIEDGTLELDAALDGQYYWIEGSVLNDGLHLNPASDLHDEFFTGRVWLLAIPQAVIELADEAGAWCEANAETLASPYQSESFGGYSYTRASSGASGNEAPAAAWQTQFGARLRPFRKLSRDWI